MPKTRLKEKREKSIQSILNAAREVFAEKGFEGARIDEIAERAHVNKAMIYYRLGDKKELFSQALHDIVGNAAEQIINDIKTDDPTEIKLRKYMSNLAKAMDANPFLPLIMMREIASGGHNLPEVVIEDILRMLGILNDIVVEGINKGIFVKINPFTLHMMLTGALVFSRGSIPIKKMYSSLLSRYIDPPVMENDFFTAKEIENLLLRAITKDKNNNNQILAGMEGTN